MLENSNRFAVLPYLKYVILLFVHQGVFLANRLQYIIRATIDCHVSLGVSIYPTCGLILYSNIQVLLS